MTKTIAVIGSGCAALEAVKAMRENGYREDIHLFSDSNWPTYNPMLVTYYISGKIDFEAMFPYGANLDIFREYDVKLHFGSPVVKLDALNKTIYNDSGVKLQYDKCLIAAGATPVIPPIKGAEKGDVYSVRTVEDAILLKQVLKKDIKRALVVGASMVGIKMVDMLLEKNVSVCLSDLADNIFSLAAHENCSFRIERFLEKEGVELKFNSAIESLEKNVNGFSVFFTDGGDPEEFDCIIMCIGVRANISFVDREQVQVDRGILIDDYMQTNCEGLYAAGDVAQGNNISSREKQIIGLWANARYQGRTAGMNMAGKEQQYHGTLPHNITHFMHNTFVGIGDVSNGDKIFEMDDCINNKYCRLVWKDGRLSGVNLFNLSEISGILKNHIVKSINSGDNYVLDTFSKDVRAMSILNKLYPEIQKNFQV